MFGGGNLRKNVSVRWVISVSLLPSSGITAERPIIVGGKRSSHKSGFQQVT